MLAIVRKRIGILLLILGAALVILARENSPSFQECITDQSANHTSQQQIESLTDRVVVPFIQRAISVRCTGHFIDENSATITAIATIAIAGFTFTLWNATKKLWETGEKQSEIAGEQTALINQQTEIITKQKEIARLQFITENGPRLRIRNIVIFPPKDYGRLLFHDREWSGRCYVENIGGMSATVIDSHLEIYANQMGLPMESPYEGKTPNNIITGSFNVGESKPFPFVQMSPLATDTDADRVRRGSFRLFVLGWIHYRDDSEYGMIAGTVHRLAFCRRWDAGKRRFVREENDPDYEHEE